MAASFLSGSIKKALNIHDTRKEIQDRMTSTAAFIREPEKIKEAIPQAWNQYDNMKKHLRIFSVNHLADAFKNMDLCLTHAVYLESIGEYINKDGKSRGSYLILDDNGERPVKEMEDKWKYTLNVRDSFVNRKILEISLTENFKIIKNWLDIRPIPREELWFESVWEDFRNNNIVK